jgi:hypothetical protein
MLPMLLFNVVSSLVIDKAQNLAKEHVEKMIDDILPDDAKEELDELVKSDPAHQFESATEALQGAVEGKLPISLKDGTMKPIELNFKVTYDPNSGKVDVVQDTEEI